MICIHNTLSEFFSFICSRAVLKIAPLPILVDIARLSPKFTILLCSTNPLNRKYFIIKDRNNKIVTQRTILNITQSVVSKKTAHIFFSWCFGNEYFICANTKSPAHHFSCLFFDVNGKNYELFKQCDKR